MNSRKIDLFYFSGTGNTYLVMDEIYSYFEDSECEIHTFKIEKNKQPEITPGHTIGILIPVAFQSTFPFIWEFIENLPQADKNDIFLVTTLSAFSGGIIGPVKKIIKKKGYNPIGAAEIIMPSNFRKKSFTSKKLRRKIDKGLKKARIFAHDLHFGFSKWRKIPVLPHLMKKISKSDKMWKKIRKSHKMEIVSSKCIRCGICFKLCPVDNITMNEYPEFSNHCELCMRCYAFCPTKAILIDGKKLVKYQAVEAEDLMNHEE